MGIRDAINSRPILSTGIATLVLAGAVVALVMYHRSQSADFNRATKFFYTVDDGKTWFVDDTQEPPPFTHEGKTAYRCYVFTSDGGKTKFVNYLERYTPEGKRLVEAQLRKGESSPVLMGRLAGSTLEVKPPLTGDHGWVPRSDPRAMAIMIPHPPSDGSSGTFEQIFP